VSCRIPDVAEWVGEAPVRVIMRGRSRLSGLSSKIAAELAPIAEDIGGCSHALNAQGVRDMCEAELKTPEGLVARGKS
jgi:hypothetical protein